MHLALIIILVLAVGGCASAGPTETPSAGSGAVDASGDWVLESGLLDGAPIPLVGGSPVTMSVSGTQVGGTAACNGYGTSVALVDGQLRFAEWNSTAMLCEDDVMASEMAFTSAMGRVSGARREGETLVLTGDGVELRFVPMAPVPIDRIVDRTWSLVSIVEDGASRPADGEPATVAFRSDGSFAGSTGCRSFTGRWLSSQGRIVATELSMDERECPPELAAQDGHVTQVIGEFTADVGDEELTLESRGGLGLRYRLAADASPVPSPT